MRRATCACGELSIECDGEPVRVSVCHCLACQKRTGSAFGVQARFPRDRVRPTDGKTWGYVADSGSTITMHFCPTCGSTVYWEHPKIEGFVMVAVGAFADPEFPAPTISIYEERCHAWVAIPGAEHLP